MSGWNPVAPAPPRSRRQPRRGRGSLRWHASLRWGISLGLCLVLLSPTVAQDDADAAARRRREAFRGSAWLVGDDDRTAADERSLPSTSQTVSPPGESPFDGRPFPRLAGPLDADAPTDFELRVEAEAASRPAPSSAAAAPTGAPVSRTPSNPSSSAPPTARRPWGGPSAAPAEPGSPFRPVGYSAPSRVENEDAASPRSSGGALNAATPRARSSDRLALSPPPEPGQRSSSGPAASAITAGAALSIAIGLFLLFAWIMRKHAPSAAAALPSEVFEALGRATLPDKQHAYLIRCGGKLLVVAGSPGQLQTLTEIDDVDEVARLTALCREANPRSSTAAFREVLAQLGKEKHPPGFIDDPALDIAAANERARSAGRGSLLGRRSA